MQGYWSVLPLPSPDPEIEPPTPILAGGFFTTEPPGKPLTRSSHQLPYYIMLYKKEIVHILLSDFIFLRTAILRHNSHTIRYTRLNHTIQWC